jgi:hypothetical protein
LALKQATQQACSVASVVWTRPPRPCESTPPLYCRKSDGLQMAGRVVAGPETVLVTVAGGLAVTVNVGGFGFIVETTVWERM